MEHHLLDSSSLSPPERASKKNKRNVNHVSRACDRCRKRKIRCNGDRPTCDVCSERGCECGYEEEDRRKSNSEIEDLKSRLEEMETLKARFASLEQILNTHAPPLLNDAAQSHPVVQAPREMAPPGSSSIAARASEMNTRPTRPLPRTAKSQPVVSNGEQGGKQRGRDQGKGKETSLSPLLETSYFERLKRSDDGPLVHFGPTSVWSHAAPSTTRPPNRHRNDSLSSLHLSPPNPSTLSSPIDWSRHLPPSLGIYLSSQSHDLALEHFASYYAPSCDVIDMASFRRDMALCLAVEPPPGTTMMHLDMAGTAEAAGQDERPWRTAYYSPLLHNAVLFLGMFMRREEWPEAMEEYERVVPEHTAGLMKRECGNPSLSSLRALNLLSSGMNVTAGPGSSKNLGYIYFGMTFAAVHALGLNINCEQYVDRGVMPMEEKDLRDNTFWTIFLQDVLRALATGRPPMLSDQHDVPFPKINLAYDEEPWYPPSSPLHMGMPSCPNRALTGIAGMRSTVFLWTTKLGCLMRNVLDAMYAIRPDYARRDATVQSLTARLGDWHAKLPTSIRRPEAKPLPHVLLLHILYNLTTIMLHRPLYRGVEGRGAEDPGSSARRCDAAANSLVVLLRLFEANHGIRNAPLTLIQAVFVPATIFLLRCVSDVSRPSDLELFDECCNYMTKLSLTWNEARRGHEALLHLRAEWLPEAHSYTNGARAEDPLGLNTDILIQPATSNVANSSSSGNGFGDLPAELHEWLMSQDFYNVMFSGAEGQNGTQFTGGVGNMSFGLG